MTIAAFLACAWLGFSIFAQIWGIGRKVTVTPTVAMVTLIINAFIIWVIVSLSQGAL